MTKHPRSGRKKNDKRVTCNLNHGLRSSCQGNPFVILLYLMPSFLKNYIPPCTTKLTASHHAPRKSLHPIMHHEANYIPSCITKLTTSYHASRRSLHPIMFRKQKTLLLEDLWFAPDLPLFPLRRLLLLLPLLVLRVLLALTRDVW